MKARTINTRKELTRELLRVREEGYEDGYRKAADDTFIQNLAVVFWTMETRFGWKGKRLRDLADALHDTDDMMCNPSKIHHRFSPLECEKHLKEKYGIDLRSEFKVKVEVKP